MSEIPNALKFLFLMCNDCDAIAKFYDQLLCLSVKGGSKEGWVNVKAGIDLCFFKGDFELPIQDEWAWQPGYDSGKGHYISWAVEYDETTFRKVAQNLQSSSLPIYGIRKPQWRKDSYWAMTTKDPMGNTVEAYFIPKNKPDSLEWHE